MALEEIVFPSNIRKIRMSAGMKMTDLAERAGMSLSAMSKVEKGVRRLNQKQMLKICGLLNCKLSDVFIRDGDAESEQWRAEVAKRMRANESQGLKIFGSGLRVLREAAGQTIAQAAKAAGMTLSVYHKIEVGQREVYNNEIADLAAVFKLTPEKLFAKIAELYKAGKLGERLEKSTEKIKSVMTPNAVKTSRKNLAPVYGTPSARDVLFKKSDENLIPLPSNLAKRGGIYAIIPNAKRLGGMFPDKTVMFVDPNAGVEIGSMAVLFNTDFDALDSDDTAHVHVVSVRADAKGKIYGQLFGPDEKITVKDPSRLHAVVHVTME